MRRMVAIHTPGSSAIIAAFSSSDGAISGRSASAGSAVSEEEATTYTRVRKEVAHTTPVLSKFQDALNVCYYIPYIDAATELQQAEEVKS